MPQWSKLKRGKSHDRAGYRDWTKVHFWNSVSNLYNEFHTGSYSKKPGPGLPE